MDWFLFLLGGITFSACATMFGIYRKANHLAQGEAGEGVVELQSEIDNAKMLLQQIEAEQSNLQTRAENINLITGQ